MDSEEILNYGREIISKEIKALEKLKVTINSDFLKIVSLIFNCKGKVILTGIGKSGIICKKIASTFSSTGTPSLYLHPAEALHGDVGVVDKNDVVIAVSVSGESDELITILPTLRLLCYKIIGITTREDSNLAKNVDTIFVLPKVEEACHLNLAPSSSSTAILALGDAIALTVSRLRDFKYEDFAIRHPGGLIGKKLILKIKDLMHSGDEIPRVNLNDNMNKVILEMSSKRLGCTGVFENEKFVGIITDGDLRRAIEKFKDISKLKAMDIMSKNPKTINEEERAFNGLMIMEKFAITVLFVTNNQNNITGIIHMHDILRSGLKI